MFQQLLRILKVLFIAFLLLSTVFGVGVCWLLFSVISDLGEIDLELLDGLESDLLDELEKFVVAESKSFPVQQVPSGELEAMKNDAIIFWDSIQSGIVPEDFVLTARDVNGFFASSDFFRSNAFFEMKQNEYKLSISFPLDGLGDEEGGGSFFNLYQTFKWDPETNRLFVKVDSQDFEEPMGQFVDVEFELTVTEDDKTLNLQVLKGKVLDYEIPKEFIDEGNNLLEELYNCAGTDDDCKRARKFVEGLSGVFLEDGQVVVQADPDPTESTYYHLLLD